MELGEPTRMLLISQIV